MRCDLCPLSDPEDVCPEAEGAYGIEMDSLQTVVNVGGDYDEESVWHKTSKINLVPYRGGVGPVTAAVLMSHVLM